MGSLAQIVVEAEQGLPVGPDPSQLGDDQRELALRLQLVRQELGLKVPGG